MAGVAAVCSDSSWPGAKRKSTAFTCSSPYTVRLTMLSSGTPGSFSFKFITTAAETSLDMLTTFLMRGRLYNPI